MIDLTPEIIAARDAGTLDRREAARLIAREKREVFSLHPELRVVSWMGAVLVAAGAGILLAQNLDRIGPAVLATAVGAGAAAAYAYAAWRRALNRTSLVDEYVLLLAALLFSADLAYIEGQFHLLDHGWPRHLLLAAVVHGLTAYYFGSRTLLTLSLAALAAWMGVEQRVGAVFDSTTETAVRALATSLLIVMWRATHVRIGAHQEFGRVFEHFAANLALIASITLAADEATRAPGVLLALALAAAVIYHGFRVRSETFVIYAYVYAVIAAMILIGDLTGHDQIVFALFFAAFVVAIAGLFRLHSAYRRRP